MERAELIIGYMLRIGLWLSVAVVSIGGVLYLMQCGHETIHYQVFHSEPWVPTSLLDIWRELKKCSAQAIIQFGLMLLILTQVLRVALTAWLFMHERDYIFTWISLIILLVLIYSIFWRD